MGISNASDDYSSPENEEQIKKWLSIVMEKDGGISSHLVPMDYRKICVGIASFLPSFFQMYLCGLLSDSQYCELVTVHQEYVTEQKAIADFCGQNVQSEDLVPTWKDLLPRLKNPVFHSPIMDVYFGLTARMDAVWKIADLDMLNLLKQYIDLDDGHYIPQILGKDEFSSHAEALKLLLCLRNGCQIQNAHTDMILHIAVDKLYHNTLNMLRKVPEDKYSEGAAKRAALACRFWKEYGPNRGLSSTKSFRMSMLGAVSATRMLLGLQSQYDKGWIQWMTDWFDNTYGDYVAYCQKQETDYLAQGNMNTTANTSADEPKTQVSEIDATKTNTPADKNPSATPITRHDTPKNSEQNDDSHTRS